MQQQPQQSQPGQGLAGQPGGANPNPQQQQQQQQQMMMQQQQQQLMQQQQMQNMQSMGGGGQGLPGAITPQQNMMMQQLQQAQNPPPGGLDPELISALQQSNFQQAQQIMMSKNIDPSHSDSEGWTPLHYSCRLGHQEFTAFLFEHNANPCQANSHGDSPLHYACSESHPPCVLLCLQRMGNPNQQNKFGNTPLHYACFWFHGGIVQALIQRGGNLQMNNADNETPISKVPPQAQQHINSVAQRMQMGQQQQMMQNRQAMAAQQQLAAQQQEIARQQKLLQDQKDAFEKQKRNAEKDELEKATKAKVAEITDKSRVKHEWEIDSKECKREKFVGRGGFGEVYFGDWQGSPVAIKTMLAQKVGEKAMAEFIGEVDVMSKLRHPNITLFMAACITPPDMCIVSEFLERGSLYSVLHDKKQEITWNMMVKMATDTARGMNYLHCFNPTIMHRDLKSLNLLVDTHWTVKVTDFGLSMMKTVGTDGTNQQCGTPQWMAPELLRNEKYNEKADVFSFGIVMWEMYTRSEPYHGMNPMQVGMKVLLEGLRPPIPPHCPHLLHRLICDCWHTDPNKRPVFGTVLERLKVIKEKTCT